jgi:hypothetical protein
MEWGEKRPNYSPPRGCVPHMAGRIGGNKLGEDPKKN